MKPITGDKLRGHLETMVLSALERGEAHGLEILRRLDRAGCELLRLREGSLYPALYRLEHRGWIRSEWGESENKRKAKFYQLTARGRKQLRAEAEQWSRLQKAVASVMSAEPEEA